MRQKVITFLESLPEAPEDQFNEALLLYMKSPVPNPGLVRSYNQQGYSVQRLKELLYDLKKAFEIKDSELVVKRAKPEGKVVQLPKTPVAPGLPQFSKGITGTAERKAYLKEHNLTSPSAKNADMDAVILEHLKSVEANKVDEALVAEIQAKVEAKEELSAELKEKANTSNEATQHVIAAIISSFIDIGEIDLAFNKVVELLKAGENVPASLVRELYNNPLMSDEHVIAITEEAKKQVTPKEPVNTPEDATETNKAAEIEVKETETLNPDSEKK